MASVLYSDLVHIPKKLQPKNLEGTTDPVVLCFAEKPNPRCCQVANTCSDMLCTGEQGVDHRTGPGLPRRFWWPAGFLGLQICCSASAFPPREVLGLQSVLGCPGRGGTEGPHDGCSSWEAHCFLWARRQHTAMADSCWNDLVLGMAAATPTVGLTDINEKFSKTGRNLKAPCCFCCRFSYQRGKHADFVVHGSALIYTDVPLFKEEILGYSDLRSAPGSRPELF